ncbi:uncharacterized protein E0L32_003861 [Thyridium curvatum]|uniref:Cytochrome c oxidase assembly factor 3 n=1 Tax=Thyridium curvatum TaxID=1093900 RepID=A0A507B9P2_9PEZI|nr:uncharacterized protein E0L32_003861 [Thyridium curvatum]TPX16567.1 hypothetical protein E0L32_003861 [Thyridium curvatum]
MAGIEKQASYYDRNHRQSPALIRARRPYLVKNAVLGAGIAAFAIGVCTFRGHLQDFSRDRAMKLTILAADAYTIHIIGQDEFEDVKVPAAPAQQAQQAAAAAQKK